MLEISQIHTSSLVPAMQGAQGPSRNKLGATSDTHAAEMWLAQQQKPETRRQYTLHALRLIAWLQSVQLTLDSCTFADMSSYLKQLDDPQALSAHIEVNVPLPDQAKFRRLFASRTELSQIPQGTAKPRKRSPRALPSAKPLARATRARKVLLSMIRWLQENGYIATFAMPRPQLPEVPPKTANSETAPKQTAETVLTAEVTATIEVRREQIRSRLLSEGQWGIVDQTIAQLDWKDPTLARCRVVATWLRESGVRRSELAGAKFEHMEWVRHDDSGTHFWLWKVIGKGDKTRYVPLSPAMLDAYKRYRLSQYLPYFEHDAFLAEDPSAFIFYDVRSSKRMTMDQPPTGVLKPRRTQTMNRPLSGTMIYNDICRLARLASQRNPPLVDERIAKLSPHWFRHRRAHDLLKKLHITKVAQYLGHASIETTKVYSFSEEVQLGHEVLNASLP